MKLVFLLLGVLAWAQQPTPVPVPADGFYLGPVSTNYTIDVFYDHLCSDSKAAFPALYQYWTANQAWLGMNIHIFPLPYHDFSFVVAQAGRYIQQSYPTKFMNFVIYMFNYQYIILNNSQNWDFPTVQSKVAGLTNQATGVAYNEVLNALDDDNINMSSRYSYKYSSSRTMTGTPLYMVNDIWVPGVSGYTTYAQWASFFSGLN